MSTTCEVKRVGWMKIVFLKLHKVTQDIRILF